MLVRKKNVVQKSFRIDQRVEADIALLAELTNRSQNDLVNSAIEEFLKDNGQWFVNNVIVEHYLPIFEYTGDDYEPIFKLDGVTVELKDEDGFYNVHYIVTNRDKVVEDRRNKIPIAMDNAEEELKERLRFIASFIDLDSADVKEYIKERIDYDDFVRVKEKK